MKRVINLYNNLWKQTNNVLYNITNNKKFIKSTINVFNFVHYNSEMKRLEATNGTVCFIQNFTMPDDYPDTDGLFSITKEGLLIETEEHLNYPKIQRIIPEESYNITDKIGFRVNYDLSSIISEKNSSVLYLHSLLSQLGFIFNDDYITLIKNILQDIPLLGVHYNKDTMTVSNHSIMLTNKQRTTSYILMPMTTIDYISKFSDNYTIKLNPIPID